MRREYLPNGEHYLVIRASRQVTAMHGWGEFAEVIVDTAIPPGDVPLRAVQVQALHDMQVLVNGQPWRPSFFARPYPSQSTCPLGTYSILLRLDGLGFGTLELEDLLRRAGVKIPSFESYRECQAWIRSTLQSSALVGRRVRCEAKERTSKMGKPMQVRKYTQV